MSRAGLTILKRIRVILAGGMIGNSAAYTLGNVLPQTINILLLPIFTRYLSRTEFGIFSYTAALCAFLAVIGNLSIHSYVLRHYFDCRTVQERRRLRGAVVGAGSVVNTDVGSLTLVAGVPARVMRRIKT